MSYSGFSLCAFSLVKVKVYYTALFGIQKKNKSTLVNGTLDTANILITIIKKSVH